MDVVGRAPLHRAYARSPPPPLRGKGGKGSAGWRGPWSSPTKRGGGPSEGTVVGEMKRADPKAMR
jgi:hypothetical protein